MARHKKELTPNLDLMLSGVISSYQHNFKEWRELQKKAYDCFDVDSTGEIIMNKYVYTIYEKIKEYEKYLKEDYDRIKELKKEIEERDREDE